MTDANIQFTEVLCDFCGGYLRKAQSQIATSKEVGICFDLPEEETVSGKKLPSLKRCVCYRCWYKSIERALGV